MKCESNVFNLVLWTLLIVMIAQGKELIIIIIAAELCRNIYIFDLLNTSTYLCTVRLANLKEMFQYAIFT